LERPVKNALVQGKIGGKNLGDLGKTFDERIF
jgi:hypothetical protein